MWTENGSLGKALAETEGETSNPTPPSARLRVGRSGRPIGGMSEANSVRYEKLADRVGFEPTVRSPARWFSRPVP